MPSNSGFSFDQIWRGGRRVVERRGPGLALGDGGSMKSADGGASVGCGGSHGVPSESLAQFFGPTVTSPSGVVTLLRALLRYPSSLGKELWVETLSSLWMDDDGVFWRRDHHVGVVLESSCRNGVVSSVAIGLV
uniref:Uncharacterized protein n=1 Tax=Oryza meridionalis TaxID=40149 RepID=A0A0E0BYH2_9ORYZ